MTRERIVWVVALLLVAGAGFYSGSVIGERTGEANRTTAVGQFFGSRGGTGQAAAGQGAGAGAAGQGAGGQGGVGGRGGLSGTINAVDGNTITITTRAGQNVKVQLAADGKVRKQVDGQLTDLTSGEQVVAIGTQNGDSFQATSIQIGGGRAGQ